MIPTRLLANAHRGLMAEPTQAIAWLKRVEACIQNASLLEKMLAEYEEPEMEIEGSVAVIPFQGMTGWELSCAEEACGMVDVEDVTEMLEEAIDNQAVKAILFDVNSPGGFVTGIEELSDMVASCPKPIETWGPSIHSAAMFATGVANRVTGMLSGTYGSIGSVIVLEDSSAAYEAAGIKVNVFASGWAKGLGTEGAPLTDRQKEFLTELVMDDAANFKAKLTAVRTTIPADAMDGQFFTGRKAAENGIITGFATKDEVIDRLNSIQG